MDVTAELARVLGCLIEKAETTPDGYPLSSNALRAACNQSTNRDPVVDYSEREVDALMLELRQNGLARTVTGSGHRVGKHKHIVDEALGLDGHELAVLAVLLLRGDQTRNEITTRTARYAHGPDGDAAVDAAIDRLASRPEPLVVRLERRPGEREPRIAQCWAERPADAPVAAPLAGQAPAVDQPPAADTVPGASQPPAADTAPGASQPPAAPSPVAELTARVAALEAAVAAQERRIDELLERLGE